MDITDHQSNFYVFERETIEERTVVARSRMAESGRWYFVVDCENCGEPIPFAEAPSPDDDPSPQSCPTVTKLECLHCGAIKTYPPTMVGSRTV
jgi:RNase P subunit RPR2